MKGHTAVARALRAGGVDTVFGLIGDANMYYVLDFVRSEQGRFVGSVIEGGAVGMADGYSRVSGRVGVVSVTHGPAAANTVNAMVEATRAHSSVLLITGDTPARRAYTQHIDLNALFGATGAEYSRVLRAEDIVDDVAVALARVAASRRPLVLDIPIDLQMHDVDYRPTRFRPVGTQAPGPDEEALDAALGVLASADRPLVLAGRGAVLAGAGPALVELADALGAPLATTASAKDMFRGHPYDLGIMGDSGLPWATEVMARADCIAAFGAGLNHWTTARGDLVAGRSVVHCDVEAANLGRFVPYDVAVRADAGATAVAMTERLRAAGFVPGSFRTGQLGAGTSARRPRDDFRDRSTRTTLDMRTALIALEEMLPPDKVVVTDGGRFMVPAWRYLHVADPRDFVHTVGFGSIGLGTAAAIGAAVAAPGRLTVGVAGDGGGMMGLIEFSTAVRHRVPFVLVILDDGAYGTEYGKLERHGYDPTSCYVEWPEFAAVATALGGTGVTVRTIEELRATAPLLAGPTTPLLIDVKADPTVDHRE